MKAGRADEHLKRFDQNGDGKRDDDEVAAATVAKRHVERLRLEQKQNDCGK